MRRWLPSWRLVLGTFVTFMALGAGVIVAMYMQTEVPTPDEFADAQTTTVYFSDGTTEMGTFAAQNRVIVDSIPQHVQDAVVAAEDRTFYENAGINVTGIARALWNNLTGGSQQGGSSITQQYAERYYIGQTVSDYRGKLEEAFIAIKLDREQDKQEILSNYLNTIYFGRDSYGIEVASRNYFGVPAADLTVAQGALLAGIIPSPNNWDPRTNPEKAEQRWNYVLDGMVTIGRLTQAERDAQVYPETIEYSRSDKLAGTNGYLLDMAKREVLAKSPVTEAEFNTRGYKIVTTIDANVQAMAVQAIAEMPADRPANVHAGLVTLDPLSGGIVALYGGPDYLVQARNAVTQDVAQAASTFKPFTLVAYLEAGGSLKSRFVGTNKMDVADWKDIRNFGGTSYGKIEVLEATAKSVNAVYAQMNNEVGPEATLDVARRAGIPEEALENQGYISNVLGTASPHPLDLAEAYNTFAAQGLHMDPFIVKSVEYLDGGLVYEGGTDAPERVFAEDVMADTTYALTQVVESRGGTARKAADVGHPVAGKTGSSNDNLSAWFVGYTRHLTTAVALYQVAADGNPEPIADFGGYDQVTGGTVPLDIWTAYMKRAMEGREVLEFPERADVGEPNTPPMVAVPGVVGMPEAEARAAIEGAGLGVNVQQANDANVPSGSVISQDPGGGTEIAQGTAVTIVVSTGPGTTAVPNVVGQPVASAQSTLQGAGFVVTTTQQTSATVPQGQVISQNPGSGTSAAPGSTVTLVVSSGTGVVEPPPVVPPGTGQPDPNTGGG
ncbi:transglycosylase domain-containing protein [Actinotalea subterranea]|uniref:transglycosylase domain-containing protein n=1 Tax=Actinotalea subterranea TaxID=2607497 RepID=UPI0011EE6C5C|nr:transglycosylase domain-containing protein [Actinotalea subterranea]